MNIVQTALVYVGIPLALALILAAAVYGRTAVAPGRYRPGRPWTYDPVWYVGHPHSIPTRPILPAGSTPAQALTASVMASVDQEATMGGASGEW
jgi:hypothetical protein